jgi:hypothetical protein
METNQKCKVIKLTRFQKSNQIKGKQTNFETKTKLRKSCAMAASLKTCLGKTHPL